MVVTVVLFIPHIVRLAACIVFIVDEVIVTDTIAVPDFLSPFP